VNYKSFVLEEAKRIGLDRLKEKLSKLTGKKVLIYTHDDPDGITAGLIFVRLLKELNIRYDILIPDTMELEEERLKNDLKKDNYEAVFVLDKATMSYYDKYYKYNKNFVIIDHHPLIGEGIKNVEVINPQIHGEYKSCSCSHLMHMLYTFFEKKDKMIDFYNLIGLKGDWAIEPATDYYSQYVKSFIDEVKDDFSFLFKKIKEEATLFEVKQREKTTLLNQITEIVFALTGGGFQYFYNDRDELLRDINQPIFVFEKLKKMDTEDILKAKSREDFINMFEDKKVELIWRFFKEDWNRVSIYFDNCIYIKTIKDTDLYMFFGNKIPLMPFVGSVKLYSLSLIKGKEKVLIMVNNMLEDGIHFSFRGTSSNIHCGELAHSLVEEILKEYNYPDQITGGGHPFAAEARTRKTNVPIDFVLKVFFEILERIK